MSLFKMDHSQSQKGMHSRASVACSLASTLRRRASLPELRQLGDVGGDVARFVQRPRPVRAAQGMLLRDRSSDQSRL